MNIVDFLKPKVVRVKQSQLYVLNDSGLFMVSLVEDEKYALISLSTGVAFSKPVDDINDIFLNVRQDFELITGSIIIAPE
jgi:hypothetical protein